MLFADADAILFAQDVATPNTILGAFILISVSMSGLVAWIVKQQFNDNQKIRDQYAANLTAVIEHCEEETKSEREASEKRFAQAFGDQAKWFAQLHNDNRDIVHELRNLTWALNLRTRLADAMQSAKVAAWTKTVDGTLLSWNAEAERMMGWKSGEVVGKSIYTTIIPPERRQEEEEVLQKIGEGEDVAEYQTDRMHRSGRRVPVVVTTSPILDREGRVSGASTLAHEV